MVNKKGISLIVLVITIIVMIILAAAVVITLSNTGIINRANEAVEKTNIKQVQQIASLAWAEAYAEGARTEEDLKAAVDKVITENEIDVSKYNVIVTDKGVEVTSKGPTVEPSEWTQTGNFVTNGVDTLEIGDTVYFTVENTNYSGSWKVWGINEAGKLLLVSSDAVTGATFNGVTFPNSLNLIQEACDPFANHDKVESARGLNIEDINKITGYDPEVEKYDKGERGEYGIEVEYYWQGNEYPYCVYNGVGKVTTSASADKYFYINNGTTWTKIAPDTSATTTNRKLFAKIKNTLYQYDIASIMDSDTKKYNMLFIESAKVYHLASQWQLNCDAFPGQDQFGVTYGLFNVGETNIKSNALLGSSTGTGLFGLKLTEFTVTLSIRPMLTMSFDIDFDGDSTNGWTLT